jgi:hypothetical protein
MSTSFGPTTDAGSPWLAAQAAGDAACDTPNGRLAGVLLEADPKLGSRLGCSIGPEQAIQAVEERFEGGYAYWRPDLRQVYILYDDATWAILVHGQGRQGGESGRPTETPPDGRLAPAREIGQVWRQERGVRARLGWAVSAQQTVTGAAQSFERGLTLSGSGQRILVLHADGTWQGFRDEHRRPGS